MGNHRLRVAFDATALPRRPAGAGVYTLELGRALAFRKDVELLVAAPRGAWPTPPTWETPPGPVRRNCWEQLKLPAEVALRDAEICHGAHFAVPIRCQIPRVATVHDVTFWRLPRRYDLSHRWYYRGLARLAARSERIIAPSAAVARDIGQWLGLSMARVRVVAEAPRPTMHAATEKEIEQACAEWSVVRPYFLCVGTAEPNKRAVDAIRAVALLRDQGVRAMLVLCGNAGALLGALERETRRLGVVDRVVFAGYVSESALRAFYSGATGLIFPSRYEGFGLPPLEAMACGTPVISTSVPAMDEVLGEAALFVPACDPVAIARAIRALLKSESLRQDWSARGHERASQFTWERAAEETVAVYQEIARP